MRRERGLHTGLGALLLAGGACFLQLPNIVADAMLPAAFSRGGLGGCLCLAGLGGLLGLALSAAGAWLLAKRPR